MASKLNPGADAALVSAAYRAGMATAPADYSDAFENVARGYEKTMQAQSKLWKNIANIGAIVGADLMQTANEFMDYRIKGAALNPDSAKFLVDELDANKQAQKDLGLFGGILGNSETRQKKRELKIKQAELFAEIDMAAASINAGAEAVAGGLYDSNLDEEGSEMVNAIIKSNLKDKVTTAGNTAVLSRDEKTGELMFTLMRDGKPATGSDGKPKTMTIKEFNKTISMNVDDKGAMQGLLNKLNDDEANAGIKSSNGVYDPERKQMALNQLDTAFKTPTDIRRGMLTKFGYSNTSFAEDVRNPSVFSAEIYGSLLRATGGGEELALGGITEGIEDTDGSGGISQDEITNNYNRFAANILSVKDPEASKAFLKEYTVKKLEEAYKYGYGKKTPSGQDWKSLGFSDIDEYMKSDYYKKNVLGQNIEEPKTDKGGYTSYDFSKSVTKSKPLKLNGENINIGSLDTIRKNISLGKSFIAGDNFFNPDGNGGWDKLSTDRETVIESYQNTNALVLEGLKTNHEGFQDLMQYEGTAPVESFYDISIMEKDDSDVKGMILTDERFKGFKVNKNIEGVYDAGVEVIEIVAPNGVDRRVIYLQGEGGTSKEEELKRLNDFLKQHSKGKYD